MPVEALALGLSASVLFALSTLVFKKFAVEVSPLWMNAFKCTVAGAAFGVLALIGRRGVPLPELPVLLGLAVSGFIGLNVGDLFLMRSFRSIGSGRTLMVFAFNPLFLAGASYLAFGEALRPGMVAGVALLSLCILLLGLESFRREKSWQLGGYGQALLACLLDSAGVLLTKWAFEVDPALGLAEANFVRCLGALCGFFLLSRYVPIRLWGRFRALDRPSKALVLGVSASGTFLSLLLWVAAIRIGPVGAIAALGATGPLLATGVETYQARRAPTWHLGVALVLFVAGVLVINLN